MRCAFCGCVDVFIAFFVSFELYSIKADAMKLVKAQAKAYIAEINKRSKS